MTEALQALRDYAQAQRTTGLLIRRDGRTRLEVNWPAPADAQRFTTAFVHGTAADGALLEDVASLQKSLVALLVAMAIERGFVDPAAPVSAYLGAGWTRASVAEEAEIRVDHLLTMTSGLSDSLEREAAPGALFAYNTPAYAQLKPLLLAATGTPLDDLTRTWLAEPLGLAETAWRPRPAALADAGNPTGLVTTARDLALVGQLVLDEGRTAQGDRLLAPARLQSLLTRGETNPAYGRLWWLNGGDFAVRPGRGRTEGPLIPTAPADLVAGLGLLDRKLYIVPSLALVVVRLGDAAPDPQFDANLWRRLGPVVDDHARA